MTNAHDATTVAADLLALLRAEPGHEDASYAQAPRRILGGFDTTVYGFQLANVEGALGRPLILRIFGGTVGAERARIEAAVQNAIAAQGYDCPRVLITGDEATIAGEHFTVMERVPGAPMLDTVLKPGIGLLRVGGMMARQHARLHDLDGAAFVEAIATPEFDATEVRQRLSIESILRDTGRSIEEHNLDELRPALRWVEEHRPPEPARLAICHSDFHPGNMLILDGEISGVIDWADVRLADPAFDVARTAVLSLYGPVDLPGFVRPLFTLVRRALNARYVSNYRRLRHLDRTVLDYYEAFVALGRFTEGYAAAVASPGALATFPWAFEGVARGLASHFSAKTGIAIDRRRLSTGTS